MVFSNHVAKFNNLLELIPMTIYIASDHRGFQLKSILIEYLKQKNVTIIDMGPFELDQEDDYPDFVIPTMKKLQENEANKAILICGNGVGVSMLANKFENIRATLSWDAKHAKSSRNDDDTNVLALPADYVDEQAAKNIVDIWLNTDFSNAERHKRRLEKMKHDYSSNS